MKKCPKCGAESNGKFCVECGTPLESTNEKINTEHNAKLEVKNSKNNKEKQKSKKTIIIIGIIVAAIILIILGMKGCSKSEPEIAEEWPSDGLLAMLPEPEGFIYSVDTIEDDENSADIKYIDKSIYEDYIELCKKDGFNTVEKVGNPSIDDDQVYLSFNDDGYRLELGFREDWSSDGDNQNKGSKVDGMEIVIHKAIESNDISWPNAGIGSKIPEPVSLKGEIAYESDTSFDVYVTNTDKAGYDSYVKELMGTKFSVDYDKYNNYYYGKNSKDEAKYATVKAEYWGNNIMHITVNDYDFSDLYEDEEDSSESDDYSNDSDSNTSTSFRDTLDEYEEFVDDYVAFMKKYKKSSDTSGMLSDYSDMLSEYSDWARAIDDIDTSELSSEDYDYYVEVTSRCVNKISKAGL